MTGVECEWVVAWVVGVGNAAVELGRVAGVYV